MQCAVYIVYNQQLTLCKKLTAGSRLWCHVTYCNVHSSNLLYCNTVLLYYCINVLHCITVYYTYLLECSLCIVSALCIVDEYCTVHLIQTYCAVYCKYLNPKLCLHTTLYTVHTHCTAQTVNSIYVQLSIYNALFIKTGKLSKFCG